MVTDIDNAAKIAEYLLKIKAVKLQPKDPFTWASGWKSPIYCDNRKTLSFPDIRTFIRQSYSEVILDKFGKPDAIVGVATGGIAQGALIAQELGVPFLYVRSSAKGHGLKNMIEGSYSEGQSVVVIEDLISTGGSSIKAVEALKSGGLNVKGVVAIFSYGFKQAKKVFEEINCPLVVLCNYDLLIDISLEKGDITSQDVNSLREWRNDPENWGK